MSTSRRFARRAWFAGGVDRVKVLGDGELTKPLTVTAHAFSKSAREKIEKAGGKVIEIPTAPVDAQAESA